MKLEITIPDELLARYQQLSQLEGIELNTLFPIALKYWMESVGQDLMENKLANLEHAHKKPA